LKFVSHTDEEATSFYHSDGLLSTRLLTDDDGAVSLTDPVYLLLHLFQGGPAAAAPVPATPWRPPAMR